MYIILIKFSANNVFSKIKNFDEKDFFVLQKLLLLLHHNKKSNVSIENVIRTIRTKQNDSWVDRRIRLRLISSNKYYNNG